MKFPKQTLIPFMLLLWALSCPGAGASGPERQRSDFDFVKESDGWLVSGNAAGLLSLPVKSVSRIEAAFGKDNGGFVNFHESDDSFDFGLQTESFYRLNERVTLYGLISYDFFQGQNMTGSVFSDPYSHLFDIVETDPERKGKKQMETYRLSGGFGAALTPRLSIGGKIGYMSRNYAKMRDLRHINSIMDMYVTAGARYRIGKNVFAGLNYFYRRSVEAVRFQAYGAGGKSYYSLISFGAFYGMREIFNGESGYTSSTSQPLFDAFHGGSLQVSFDISPKVNWFHEFGYRHRDGYYGEKSSKTVTFTGHSGNIFSYSSMLTVREPDARHKVSLSAVYDDSSNDENVYRMTGGASDGNSTVEYFGSNEVLSRQTVDAELGYAGWFGTDDLMPDWSLQAGLGYSSRTNMVSVYPFFRRNATALAEASVSGKKNFIRKKNMFSAGLGVGGGCGWGTMKDDGSYTAVSDDQEKPAEGDYFLCREFEYLTAPRVNAEAVFRYSRFFGRGFTGYVQLSAGYVRGFGLRYIGNDAVTAVLTVGCSF